MRSPALLRLARGLPALLLASMMAPRGHADPERLVVQLRPGSSVLDTLGALGNVVETHPLCRRRADHPAASSLDTMDDTYVLEVPPSRATGLAQRLRDDPRVVYAQPDHLYEVHAAPASPFWTTSASWGQPYADLWNLKKLDLERAWNVTRGAGVVVAIVDSGIDPYHQDLFDRIWTNPVDGTASIVYGDTFDNDANGFIDDGMGWNFTANDNDITDRFGHGTYLAGIVAAAPENGDGLVGVAPQARIMAVKAVDDRGQTSSARLAAGIVYAVDNGARIVLAAAGCTARCPSDPVVEHAIRHATAAGALVIVSAGNRGDDVAFYSPQNMVDAKPLVVSATTHLDGRASFSNFGSLVDLSAPGGGTNTPPPTLEPVLNVLSLKSSVCSTVICPPGLIVLGGRWHEPLYVRRGGTSMAAAHVAGVAALILSTNPTMPLETLRLKLLSSAVDLGPPGHDPTYGVGRISAGASLQDDAPFVLARLFAPFAGQRLSGSVRIAGAAAARSFSRYELSIGDGDAPSSWETTGLGPFGEATSQGDLGTWDTEGVADGPWTIRLVVRDTTGRSREVRRTVSVDNSRARRALSVDLASDAAGRGSVSLSNTREICDGAAGATQTCSYLIDRGETVTLTALPDALSTFGGWSGACAGTGSCTVSMTELRRVRATFLGPRRLVIVLTKIRDAAGFLTVTPRDKNCNPGQTCTYLYKIGTPVMIRAFPDDPPALPGGTVFLWDPGQACERNECAVAMNDHLTLRATFAEEPDEPWPNACCSGTFELGTPVELFAYPSSEVPIVFRLWLLFVPRPDGTTEYRDLGASDVVTVIDLPLGVHTISFTIADEWGHYQTEYLTITIVPPGTLPPASAAKGAR